ncbi:MAG: hypothetical protein N2255_09825 [Kiritimatiellae bacterium]|nr:hypothetical protein [Kiritimatiellia bacterium]
MKNGGNGAWKELSVALAACTFGLFNTVGRADFELPLYIRETQGSGGTKYIANGVPLAPGMAAEPTELHVIGPDGREVPAQFRVLARYWRRDNSIRWVLASFMAEVPEKGETVYRLVGRNKGEPVPGTPMKVEEDGEFIRVNTGAALFEISKKRFNLLNKVQVDADLDGRFTDAETVVHPDPQLGSVVTDPQGRRYYGSEGTKEVRLLDQGPVRVMVVARGVHVSRETGAFQPGLYGYEIFLTFHAGQPYCNVDAVLCNNFAESIGEPHFEDWSIITRIGSKEAGGAGMNVLTSGGYSHPGCAAGESLLLYQDSVGTPHWKKCPGFEPRTESLATFRGYKLFRVAADGVTKTEIEAGDFARGCAQCGRSALGCVIAPKYFWQQFPKALQYFSDGTLRYGLFPAEYSQVHWLEDGSAKGYEFQLFFYIKGAARQYTAMNESGRPYAHVVMDAYLSQPMALPSPSFCAEVGALSDLGPYLIHERLPIIDFPLERWERRYLMDDYLKGNGYGWQVFGNRWEEMAGHSPWNYEPRVTSISLFNYLVTRQPNWLERGLRIARQARDVRAYLIDDPDLLEKWSKPGAYNRMSIIEMWRRKQPSGEPHPYKREWWPLPNHEHLCLDEVYDLYLLTGDERARRCMEIIATHAAMLEGQKSGYQITVTRSHGWGLRALARYYELTGDKRFEPYLRNAMDRFWNDINKAGTGGGAWFLGIFARGVAAAYEATGDERMRDLALGLADWAREYGMGAEGVTYQAAKDPWLLKPEERGGKCAWANAYQLDTHAWAYRQTGNPVYLKTFEFLLQQLGYPGTDWLGFLPTAFYNAYGSRPDSIPPAAVTDLKAVRNGPGEVILTWTAPGDDERTGRASVYQIKYATKPILEFVPWPDKKDTHITFWGAENVSDEPQPAEAGSVQTYSLKGLAPGTYYFALKTRDEANNQSPLSNVAACQVE